MTTTAVPVGIRLLKVSEVAERLGTSVRMVWRLIAAGDLKPLKIGRRGTRIAEADLNGYIAKLSEAAR